MRRRAVARVVVVLLVLSMTLPFVLLRCDEIGRRRPVVIWHSFTQGSREDLAIRQVLSVLAAEGREITLEIVALGDLFGLALAQALQTGNFPDLLMLPAEWAPTLYRAGLAHTLPLEAQDDWLPAVAAALTRDGQLIGLPLFCSTLALGRAQSLSGQPWPDSLAALGRQAREAVAGGGGGAYWPIQDLFYTVPWYMANGGELELGGAPGTDPPWDALPAVDSPSLSGWLAAVDALRSTATLEVPENVIGAWLDGKVAFGPLIPGELSAMRSLGASVDIGPLPGAVSLLSTWAMMLVRTAPAPRDDAVELVIRLRAGGDDGLLYLAAAVGFLPPRYSLFDNDLVGALGLAGYLGPAADAVPMPSGRYAAEVWAIFETALLEYVAGAKANEVISRLRDSITQLAADH